MNIRETLHTKRLKSERHIRALEQAGKAGKRYTATMPDMPFLVLALSCDIGWMTHLVAGVVRLASGFHPLLFLTMLGVVGGVGMTVYLDAIQEKVFARGFQKDLSFGLTVFSGLAGGIIGVLLEDRRIAVGGFLNFTAGLPLYLSFKPGIRYGIR